MKYLYCWRAFKRKEGPLLIDTRNVTGSSLYTDKIPRKCDWFRLIGCLESLNTLSVNYAYIATPTGDLLVNLAMYIQCFIFFEIEDKQEVQIDYN